MRISVTWLEAFRLYSDPENEWFDEARLIAQIRGDEPPGEPALLGIAFHRALETRAPIVDAYTFEEADIKRILARDMGHPVVSEVKLEKDFRLDGQNVTVVGKVDSCMGLVARETKTSEKPVEVEKWYHSAQWRFYLLMGGFDRIDYAIYQLKNNKGVWSVANEALFTLYPYRNMEGDCLGLLREFLGWSSGKDLERRTTWPVASQP